MRGSSHAAMSAAAGLAAARLLQLDQAEAIPAIALCAAAGLLPDVDEPGSYIGRRMHLVGAGAGATLMLPTVRSQPLDTTLLLLLGSLIIGALLPGILKLMLGHRGVVHHPLLAVALASMAGIATLFRPSPMPLFLALGWAVHLLGDSLTIAGLPWLRGRRVWSAPRDFRIRTGAWQERIIVGAWLLVGLGLTGTRYLQMLFQVQF